MTGNIPKNPQPTTGEKHLLASSALKQILREENLRQTLIERRQRAHIGGMAAMIVAFLPLFLLCLFWGFFTGLWLYAPPSFIAQVSWLLAVMFAVTHASVVALYYSLLKGMFQKIGEDKADKDEPHNLGAAAEVASAVKDITQG